MTERKPRDPRRCQYKGMYCADCDEVLPCVLAGETLDCTSCTADLREKWSGQRDCPCLHLPHESADTHTQSGFVADGDYQSTHVANVGHGDFGGFDRLLGVEYNMFVRMGGRKPRPTGARRPVRGCNQRRRGVALEGGTGAALHRVERQGPGSSLHASRRARVGQSHHDVKGRWTQRPVSCNVRTPDRSRVWAGLRPAPRPDSEETCQDQVESA